MARDWNYLRKLCSKGQYMYENKNRNVMADSEEEARKKFEACGDDPTWTIRVVNMWDTKD